MTARVKLPEDKQHMGLCNGVGELFPSWYIMLLCTDVLKTETFLFIELENEKKNIMEIKIYGFLFVYLFVFNS